MKWIGEKLLRFRQYPLGRCIGLAILVVSLSSCARQHQEFYNGYGLDLPALFGPSSSIELAIDGKAFPAEEFASRLTPASFFSYTPARLKILTMRFSQLEAQQGVPERFIEENIFALLSPDGDRDVRSWSTGKIVIFESAEEEIPVSPSESVEMKSVHYLFEKDPTTYYLLSGYAATENFEKTKKTFHAIARSLHYL